MGTEVAVASSVYNLAGAIENRPNYLKTALAAAIFNNNYKGSFTTSIRNSYLRGAGIQFRRYANWAVSSGYNQAVGGIDGYYAGSEAINDSVIESSIREIKGIPTTSGLFYVNLRVVFSTIAANNSYFVGMQYMSDTHPAELDSDWTIDLIVYPNVFRITRSNGIEETFTVSWYSPTTRYLLVRYVKWYSTVLGINQPVTNGEPFIYEQGTGRPELDAMFSTEDNNGSFLPFIPIRINNEFIDDGAYDNVHTWSKKAYKKLSGNRAKLSDVIKNIKTSPDVGDMDYIYITCGVSLNTLDNSAKRYLFEFFRTLQDRQNLNPIYVQWRTTHQHYIDKREEHSAWQAAQSDPSNPLYGTPEPVVPEYVAPPKQSVSMRGISGAMNFNMIITYGGIEEDLNIHSGLVKNNAKVGDIVLKNATGVTVFEDSIELLWQITPNTYRSIEVSSLHHSNLIYGGKTVEISWQEALYDTEESGFLFPIHIETMNRISLVDATQMATASIYLTINAYVVRKKKWYEDWFFMLIVIVVVITIAVFTGFIDVNTMGLLGSAGSVGTAIGFSGTLAVIAGAAVNAIAGILLLQLIGKLGAEIFGVEFAAIFSALVLIVAPIVITTGSLNFIELLTPTNLANLASAIGESYQVFLQKKAIETYEKTEEIIKQGQKKQHEIDVKFMNDFGGSITLNPTQFMRRIYNDITVNSNEDADTFLKRTKISMSEIIELVYSKVNSYTDLQRLR